MIDINDPRNEHLIAHPHFLSGIEHERERIIALLEQMIMTPPRDDENIHAWRGKFRALSNLQNALKGENK
jgi:hypothetical protein